MNRRQFVRAASLLFLDSLVACVGQTRRWLAGPVRRETPCADGSRGGMREERPWQRDWDEPPVALRPLQIIHDSDRTNPHALMGRLKAQGLGGLVTNVSWSAYLRWDVGWRKFREVLAACREAGLRLWIYDEEGYPSGAAGGRVLEQNPDYEALALTYDPDVPEPFALRRAFEYTHAANNFHKVRRYPNLLDDRATQAFLELTYEEYYRRCGTDFAWVEAFFTDEPSLMAVNIGQLSRELLVKVPLVDAPDPTLPALPTVPWSEDLPTRYQERYGEDLIPLRKSLFTGNTPADRQVRVRFWSLVAELVRERYFAKLGRWCVDHGMALSGHCLHEESLIAKVPLEGNPLANLREFQIPGMDLLTSDPAAVLQSGWLTALLPASAAMHQGRRLVMSEVSDFMAQLEHRSHANLTAMQATAAWQAALGVTEFALYYQLDLLPPGVDRAYTQYVGRLNALLRAARPDYLVLLYYPIRDLWAEYLPMARPLSLTGQLRAAETLVTSFMNLGRALLRQQTPFALADHEALVRARVERGQLCLGDDCFEALILPSGAELPSLPRDVARWCQKRGHVLQDGGVSVRTAKEVARQLARGLLLEPSGEQIVVGRFVRDGWVIALAVNVGKQDYVGRAALSGVWGVETWDPASGAVAVQLVDTNGWFDLELSAQKALFLVGRAKVN